MIKISPLKPGDTIGIAAPASHFDKEAFLSGVKNLKEMGFKVVYREDIFEKERYLAGTDERRASELIDLLQNKNINAILFARGGYGMMRLIPYLEKIQLEASPKIVLGYSDITTLLIYLMQKLNWVTFYGPVVAKDMSHFNDDTKKYFLNAVSSTKALGPFHFPETETIQQGIAEGILTGGCLSLVVSTLGTPFEIDTKNKILFLEDINEKAYSVDRMLTQLKLAGKLDHVRGILCGTFENGGNTEHIGEAIADVLKDKKIPILTHFPAGHSKIKVTLPLGISVCLDATNKTVSYLEGALK